LARPGGTRAAQLGPSLSCSKTQGANVAISARGGRRARRPGRGGADLYSSYSHLCLRPAQEVERRAERAGGAAVGIPGKRPPQRLGAAAVLEQEGGRYCGVLRIDGRRRAGLWRVDEDFRHAAICKPPDADRVANPSVLDLEQLVRAAVGKSCPA